MLYSIRQLSTISLASRTDEKIQRFKHPSRKTLLKRHSDGYSLKFPHQNAVKPTRYAPNSPKLYISMPIGPSVHELMMAIRKRCFEFSLTSVTLA